MFGTEHPFFYPVEVNITIHCPADAKAIDQGLANMQLSDEVRTAVTDLREKGMAQHDAGDHGAAEKTLAEAMRMLLSNTN